MIQAGWGEDDAAGGDGLGSALSIEWVVDIADKDNDWFVATAYSYNDLEQTVYVMVPDRDAPTWAGTVTLNHLVRALVTEAADITHFCTSPGSWSGCNVSLYLLSVVTRGVVCLKTLP